MMLAKVLMGCFFGSGESFVSAAADAHVALVP